jgi:hypothetical protein
MFWKVLGGIAPLFVIFLVFGLLGGIIFIFLLFLLYFALRLLVWAWDKEAAERKIRRRQEEEERKFCKFLEEHCGLQRIKADRLRWEERKTMLNHEKPNGADKRGNHGARGPFGRARSLL